jgi:transcription initiation factor TFIID subunit 7
LLENDAKAEKVQFGSSPLIPSPFPSHSSPPNSPPLSSEMLDYDVPSDDEDYDPSQHRVNLGGGAGGSGSGGGNDFESVGAPTPRYDGGASSPAAFGGDDGDSQRGGEDDDESEDEEGGSGYDSDLAKEIEMGLNAAAPKNGGGTDDSGSDGDGLFGGSSDDDDDEEEEEAVEVDPETLESRKRLKLLAEEIVDLEKASSAAQLQLNRAANPIFKVRSSSFLLFNDELTFVPPHRNASKTRSRSSMPTGTSSSLSATLSLATSTRNGQRRRRQPQPKQRIRPRWRRSFNPSLDRLRAGTRWI